MICESSAINAVFLQMRSVVGCCRAGGTAEQHAAVSAGHWETTRRSEQVSSHLCHVDSSRSDRVRHPNVSRAAF